MSSIYLEIYDKIINGYKMFIDIFNDLLDERNLNRKQFAEQSGIPYTTVIGWTNLNRLPDYNALIKISDFFQCSVDYLVGRQNYYDYAPQSISMSKQEQKLISNYRKLSQNDKDIVQTITSALVNK